MKQVILMRTDLGMGKGKMAAQAAHAAVMGMIAVGQAQKSKWLQEGMPKIVIRVSSEEELLDLLSKANAEGIEAGRVTDAGLTKFGGAPTITCGFIGPHLDEKINPIVEELKLL